MQVWACSVFRDEADIIEFTLAHLISQGVDGFVLMDHGSTDGTRGIVDRLMENRDCLLIAETGHEAFDQGAIMTSLADEAMRRGADWIIPFDADELWYTCAEGNLADSLRRFQGAVMRVPLWDHLPTTRDTNGTANPFRRMPYRKREMFSAQKITYRAASAGDLICSDGSHIVVDRRTTLMPRATDGPVGIRHFPLRGCEHFVQKTRKMAAGLDKAHLPDGVGIQWRTFGRLDDAALRSIYYARYYTPDPEDNGMLWDPAPYKGAA